MNVSRFVDLISNMATAGHSTGFQCKRTASYFLMGKSATMAGGLRDAPVERGNYRRTLALTGCVGLQSREVISRGSAIRGQRKKKVPIKLLVVWVGEWHLQNKLHFLQMDAGEIQVCHMARGYRYC